MSTTILEALQNSKINFENLASMAIQLKHHPIYMMAMDQLKNGVEALENGHPPDFVIQESMFGEIKK